MKLFEIQNTLPFDLTPLVPYRNHFFRHILDHAVGFGTADQDYPDDVAELAYEIATHIEGEPDEDDLLEWLQNFDHMKVQALLNK